MTPFPHWGTHKPYLHTEVELSKPVVREVFAYDRDVGTLLIVSNELI